MTTSESFRDLGESCLDQIAPVIGLELTVTFEGFPRAFGGRPYARSDGGPSAAGVERDGVVIVWPTPEDKRTGFFMSLRTSALGDGRVREASLARIGVEGGARVTLAGARVEVLPYLPRYLAWCAEGTRALVRGLTATQLAAGAFEADPRASAPEAVVKTRAAHGIDEDAATLLLQLRALAEPTVARVRRYNDWTRARYDDAAAALVAKELAVAATHKGIARLHWLPGALAFFDRYPAPVERVKLDAYALTEGAVPLFDVPLPIAPLGPRYVALAG